jgi:hypothetical protein
MKRNKNSYNFKSNNKNKNYKTNNNKIRWKKVMKICLRLLIKIYFNLAMNLLPVFLIKNQQFKITKFIKM